MASDVLQDRSERIALDLTKLILEKASTSPINEKHTPEKILKIYIDSYHTVTQKTLPSK